MSLVHLWSQALLMSDMLEYLLGGLTECETVPFIGFDRDHAEGFFNRNESTKA